MADERWTLIELCIAVFTLACIRLFSCVDSVNDKKCQWLNWKNCEIFKFSNAPLVSNQIGRVREYFAAVDTVTFEFLLPEMYVFNVNIQICCLVEWFSAKFADFRLNLRMSALVWFQLRCCLECFVAKWTDVIFDSSVNFQMNFKIARRAEELWTLFACKWFLERVSSRM